MAYKKHRLTTKTLVLILTLTFLIGFFMAYNLVNIQHRFFDEYEKITTQAIETSEIIKRTTLPPGGTQATTKIVAVNPNGEGLIGDLIVEVVPGDGKVLVNTNPFLEPDTQYSAVTAVEVAKEITKEDLTNKNVVIYFDINGTVLGGPSAGAAITIATISALQDKPLKEGILVTGNINEDGTIGKVGSLIEKGDAAADNGYKTFLIPAGQSKFTYYERDVVKREVGGVVFYKSSMVPKTIDLKEYFQESGMKVIEVNNVREVVDYML